MTTLTLTRVTPASRSDSGIEDNNQAAIENVINGGLDDTNILARALSLSRLKQSGGADGLVPVWSTSANAWVPATAEPPLRKSTTKTVVNTVTETDLLNGEITLPANALGLNGRCLFVMSGQYLNNSGGTRIVQVKLKLGATTLWDSGTTGSGVTALANARTWTVIGVLANAASAAVQMLMGVMLLSGSNGVASGLGALGTDPQGAFGLSAFGAEDTTAAKLLQFTITHPVANASLSMSLIQALFLPMRSQ